MSILEYVKSNIALVLSVLAAIALALLAWAIFEAGVRHGTPAAEVTTHEAAQSQPDGSVVLERTPSASAPASAAKPKHDLPKGTTLERQVSVTVRPRAALKVPGQSGPACPDVTVDMSVVRDDKGGRRVVASSPDGTVVAGMDVPIEAGLQVEPAKQWAAGLSCDARQSCGIKSAGVWIERDIGRLRVGIEGTRDSARVRAGWTF